MNRKADNHKQDSKNVGSPWKKWLTRFGIGAFMIGAGVVAYNEYKRLTEVPEECEDDETSSTNDSNNARKDEEITEINEIDYFDKSELLNELKSELENHQLFGPGEIIVLDYNEDDLDADQKCLDDIHGKFVAVRYYEFNGNKDGRFNLVIKLPGKVEKSLDEDEVEPLEKSFKDLVNEAKELDYSSFKKIKAGVRSLAFIGEIDGKNVSDLTYSELRKLDSLEGIRYISIDLYGCESDDGVDFVKRLLSLMHPDGGEYGSELDLMPVILVMENGRMELPSNNVVRNFFKTMNAKK